MQGTILVCGNDEMLVRTRGLILEKAGYQVFTALTFSNAMLVLMNQQIDIVVLCQSLTDEERHGILETSHALQPKTRCAALSFDGSEVVTDGVFIHRGLNGPPALLAAIGQMLQEKTA
jgi:DNA-binding response OmpR family regulator